MVSFAKDVSSCPLQRSSSKRGGSIKNHTVPLVQKHLDPVGQPDSGHCQHKCRQTLFMHLPHQDDVSFERLATKDFIRCAPYSIKNGQRNVNGVICARRDTCRESAHKPLLFIYREPITTLGSKPQGVKFLCLHFSAASQIRRPVALELLGKGA